MRLQYPSDINIILVPCTGKVDVLHILHAFEKGADGVYAVGCMEGDCHYNSGNLRARKRVEQAQSILETIGIGGERAQMYNLSSSEGAFSRPSASAEKGHRCTTFHRVKGRVSRRLLLRWMKKSEIWGPIRLSWPKRRLRKTIGESQLKIFNLQ